MHNKKHKTPFDEVYGFMPAHIQSYFLVVNKKLLISNDFKSYWDNLHEISSFNDAIIYNEVVFTKHFEDLGYTWGVFFENKGADVDFPYNPYIFSVVDSLKCGMPTVKRKLFSTDLITSLSCGQNEEAKRVLDWIETNSNYDTSHIWQNLLRNFNITDIVEATNLNYILSTNFSKYNLPSNAKVVVVVNLHYLGDSEYYFKYLLSIPEPIDVLITTDTEENINLIHSILDSSLGTRLTVLKKEGRGGDVSSLLVASKPYLKQYDFICFIHDQMTMQAPFPFVRSLETLLWENTLSSNAYIKNILSTFDSNPHLGLLLVPSAFSPGFAHQKWWGKSYDATVLLLKLLNIDVPIKKDKACISVGNAFWCRSSALQPLWDYNWEYEDFPNESFPSEGTIVKAIEHCFPFVAQNMGYYSGICMTEEYASMQLNDYKYAYVYEMPVSNKSLGESIGILNAVKIFLYSLKASIISLFQ